MINAAIVLSKNRPMQVDALLSSMMHYAPQLFRYVCVLYTFDSSEYEEGYENCKSVYPYFDWYREAGFYPSLLQVVERCEARGAEQITFFSDDNLFYRYLPSDIFIPRYAFCYSLRLGMNITYCYTIDRPQVPGELDFDYPISTDGTFYRFRYLAQRIRETPMTHPCDIENKLPDGDRKVIAYGPHSSIVSIPHNRVVSGPVNRGMGGSALELQQRYAQGHRINFFAMDFSHVNSPHCEIPYVFTERA